MSKASVCSMDISREAAGDSVAPAVENIVSYSGSKHSTNHPRCLLKGVRSQELYDSCETTSFKSSKKSDLNIGAGQRSLPELSRAT